MSGNEPKIKSVSDFLDSIKGLITKDNLKDKTIFFRGHRSKSWKSIPGIGRDKTPGLLENEHLIFRDFLARYDDEFQTCRSTFDILTKMQHYELPTRLLDVTTNALVALYFACLKEPEGKGDKDGEVLIYAVPNECIKHFDSDSVAILSNLAKCKCNDISDIDLSVLVKAYSRDLKGLKDSTLFSERLSCITSDSSDWHKLKRKFNNDNGDKLSYLWHEVKSERPHFREDEVFPPDLGRVWAVRAKKNNPRIIAQSGDFFLFGLGVGEKKVCKGFFLTKLKLADLPENWIIAGKTRKHNNGNDGRIIIDSTYKTEILKELESLGIKESTLLPEMTIYAKELRNKYSVMGNETEKKVGLFSCLFKIMCYLCRAKE